MENVPKIGDWIYVPTSLYLSHGVDDFMGGKALVVATGEWPSGTPWVKINERRSTQYSWPHLAEQQDELRERFGDQHAHPDPDYSPESNEWW